MANLTLPNGVQSAFATVVMGLGDAAWDTTLKVMRVGDAETIGGRIFGDLITISGLVVERVQPLVDQATAAAADANVVAVGTDLRGPGKISIVAGGLTQINAVATDLALGAGSAILGAPASAALARRFATDATDIDVVGGQAGDRGAKFWSIAAQALLARFTAVFPVFTARSGVAWAVTDNQRRKLMWIERATGIFRVSLPTVFAKAVTLAGGATLSGRVGISQAAYGAQNIDYPVFAGRRSGWLMARTDSALRVLFGLRSDKTAWVFGRRLLTTDDLTGLPTAPTNPGTGTGTGPANVSYPVFAGIRSGWIFARTDSARRVLFGQRRDRSLWVVGKRLLTSDDLGSILPLSAKPDDGIAEAYGDSLTAGSGETPYPLQLAALIGGGFVANNKGVGSQKGTQIAMRSGALPTYLTVQGNAIPAGANAVSVTAINGVAPVGFATGNTPDYRLLSRGDGNFVQTLTGYIAGVHGTLTRTSTGGPPSTAETYTFTPDAGTSGATCPANTLFVPDDRNAAFRRELWLELGRNNSNETQRVRDDVTAMVKFYRPTIKRILVFGVLNGANDPRGSGSWQSIVDLNNFLRQDHPNFYVVDAAQRDLRERVVAGYNASIAQDVTDFGNDVTPTSLRRSGDPLHLNTAGYAVQAQLGLEFRTARFS